MVARDESLTGSDQSLSLASVCLQAQRLQAYMSFHRWSPRDTHPQTSVTAWYLLRSLLVAKPFDTALVEQVVRRWLLWLKSADSNTLSADQRFVRDEIEAMVRNQTG